MVEWFNLSIHERRNQFSLLCKIAFQSQTSCFNPRRNRRRSCFVGEFEKKDLVVYTNFLLMLLTDAVIVFEEIERNQEQWSVLCSSNGPRGLHAASNIICDRLICAVPIISRKGHLTLISIDHTFFVISEKVGQTSTVSQSLKGGSLLQHMKGIRRWIWFKFCLEHNRKLTK